MDQGLRVVFLWRCTKVWGKPQYVTEYSTGCDLGPSTWSSDYQRLLLISCCRKSNNVIWTRELCKWVIFLVSSQFHYTCLLNHIHNPYVPQDLQIYHKLIRNRGKHRKQESKTRKNKMKNIKSPMKQTSHVYNCLLEKWL